jgi:biopolymer transport protein ExbD
MKRAEHPQVEMQIAPLIDVCFLLLFFYILTSKPVQPEGDIGVCLPGVVAQAESIEFPDDQRIQILETGAIVLNEEQLDNPYNNELPNLRALLFRYKESALANKSTPLVTLDAADNSKHQRIIDVLNVCAQDGITQVTFAGVHDETP